ncbi:hypothetical protein [Candidatus Entotheonella palauensis]|uniref:hypothetical protein n=1 Tax=Candidatus Entotheonella palauensis TaxID=93172 RepID=UPI001178183C|nr:hypothetical protein [Candidatus Entotheonella palauensis]
MAYQLLRPRTRQGYHERIAQVLTEHFPEMASSQPELLARHYTAAGEDEVAVHYWLRAGQSALKHSANLEAIAHLTQGLALLTRLPDTSVRMRQELELQIALGTALMNTKGYASPDAERVFARAQTLCEQTGDIPQLITVLGAVQLNHLSAGNLRMVAQIGEQMLHLAQGHPDPAFFVLAHLNLGTVLFFRGELTFALARQQQVLVIYTTLPVPQDLIARFGAEFGSLCYMYMALSLWLLGYADQARQHFQVARTLAQEMPVIIVPSTSRDTRRRSP